MKFYECDFDKCRYNMSGTCVAEEYDTLECEYRKAVELPDDECFVLTPKGIAAEALMLSGLCEYGDRRIETFWKIFSLGMEKSGYIKEE